MARQLQLELRMRKPRLGDVLFYASLIALPACEFHHETQVFASRAEYEAKIELCLNEGDCAGLCDDLIPPDQQGDSYELERCDIVSETDAGVNVEIEWTETVDCGRRPLGFVELARKTGAAGWLAAVARLEAASITAFRHLATRLASCHAPSALVGRARAAVVDEQRHARAIASLARRLGARVERPTIVERQPPSLLELAVDNAVEGQVGETIGALVATCQGRAAAGPLRALFASIARDEASHAELAHDLARWLDTQLGQHDRRRVRDAA